jgi:hypothetical protein
VTRTADIEEYRVVATSDAVVLGSELDDVDLVRPIVEMYTSAIKLP